MVAPLHLSGVLLPAGEHTDLWVVDGELRFDPVAGATTVVRDGWILPGLVDSHCHIGLDRHGAVDAATAERQAITDRNAGTLLIRDAGSAADTRWVDARPDLPHLIRAGRHIARPRRYLRHFAVEVEPEDLVAEVRRQARRSDGWVKLVGDWIDRAVGDLRPLWPTDIVEAAIAAAHAEGARVTAHCFDEASVTQLVTAGIDCIEHGTGLDDTTIQVMAERQVALVPTLINLETFPQIAEAGQVKFPRYAAHMRALHARRFETIGQAIEAGVPVYAGTDAGGTIAHGRLPEEISLLSRVAGPERALAAASWAARAWLGRPGLTEGASADLLVYADDPRTDLGMVSAPHLILLGGVPL
ncbi:MAG: amidohydrolase family protein [Propioniciclava sp.]